MPSALFIDLPNLYTQLVKSGLTEPKAVRDYFLNWLDFNTLTSFLAGHNANTWVFYSHGRLGPSDARIDDEYLNQFIDRINRHTGVTAHDVNIPGIQRETLNIICQNCGQQTATTWNSEKGIDASLIVHLFDTMDSWDTAYLLSGDADFVPAVRSLRRRGKFVNGAGFSTASSALVRECYEYIDLQKMFFAKDIAAYLLFRPGQFIEKWMTAVMPRKNGVSPKKLEVGFQWISPSLIELYYKGNYDFSTIQNELTNLPDGGTRVNIRDGGDNSDNGSLSIALEEFTRKRVEVEIKVLDTRLDGLQIARDDYGGPHLLHRLTYNWDDERKQYIQFIPDANYHY